MDDERPPKRVHESPYKASQSDGPLSPSSYAQVAAAGTSTESPQLVQPKKTRNSADVAERDRRALEAASEQLAAKGNGRGKAP